jgi:hypothetical protein
MARDETKAATDQDLQISFRNVREMTKIAEHEIHAIVLSCARARRQVLAVLPTTKPTLQMSLAISGPTLADLSAPLRNKNPDDGHRGL